MFTVREGGKKLALFGAVGIGFTIISLVLFAAYLLKGAPDIYDHPIPFCEGKNSAIKGEYLSFEQLPSTTLSLLKVAEPNINRGVVGTLESQMKHDGEGEALWHLRGGVMTIWIRQYNESDLIAYYLNKVYFGEGCYGIDAAAKAYFKKDISLLTLEETAELFAMLKSPSGYSIIDHPDRNKERANSFIKEINDRAKSN